MTVQKLHWARTEGESEQPEGVRRKKEKETILRRPSCYAHRARSKFSLVSR